jgi:hydrogenase 3 maturation protease
MGLNPGEIRRIDPDDIAKMFMMTAYNMPLNYLVDQLRDDGGKMIFLGIQPNIVGFYYPMTEKVKGAVETVYECLAERDVPLGFGEI